MTLNAAYGVPATALAPGFRGALVRLDTNQTILNATDTKLEFDFEVNQVKVDGLKWWLGADATFTADDTLDELTVTVHGMVTGDGPFEVSTDTTLPAGLVALTNYWTIRVDDDKFKVALSKSDADAGTAVDIIDTGTGVHTLRRGNRLVVPPGITKVRVGAGIRWQSNSVGRRLISIEKNKTTFGGQPITMDEGFEFSEQNIGSGVLVVVEGDVFEVEVNQNSTVSLAALQSADNTWFSIEEVT